MAELIREPATSPVTESMQVQHEEMILETETNKAVQENRHVSFAIPFDSPVAQEAYEDTLRVCSELSISPAALQVAVATLHTHLTHHRVVSHCLIDEFSPDDSPLTRDVNQAIKSVQSLFGRHKKFKRH